MCELVVAFPVSRGDSENRVERAPADQTGYERHEAEYLEDRSEQIIADDKPAKIDYDKTYDDSDDSIAARFIHVLHR